MSGSSWYQENLTLIKYWLLIINIFFMIVAIKAVVNHQVIVDSIAQVQYETEQTEEQTHYVNNFLTPYLKSEFAPYFFAHENNQIFPWEKIIKIITIDKYNDTQFDAMWSWSLATTTWKTNISQRNLYITQLTKNISIWYNNIPFLK